MSGRPDEESVLYDAPPSNQVAKVESVHSFEDDNGRNACAIVGLAIVQDHRAPVRPYDLARQFLESRSGYCEALNPA